MSEPKLPALPEPSKWTISPHFQPIEAYTADQVRSIQLATLEFAASLCDEQKSRSKELSERAQTAMHWDIYHHSATTAGWCAAAIRNAGEPQP